MNISEQYSKSLEQPISYLSPTKFSVACAAAKQSYNVQDVVHNFRRLRWTRADDEEEEEEEAAVVVVASLPPCPPLLWFVVSADGGTASSPPLVT